MKTINAFGITFLFLMLIVLLLDCCTLAVTTIHTQGKADDVVNDVKSNIPQTPPVELIPEEPSTLNDKK